MKNIKNSKLFLINALFNFLLIIFIAAGLSGCGKIFDLINGANTLVRLEINPVNGSIAKGTSQQLTATGIYGNNTTKDLTSLVTWQSSDTNNVTLSNDGNSTAEAVGISSITASFDGKTASATMTVTNAEVVTLQVSPGSTSLAVGFTRQYSATGIFTDNSTQDLTAQVAWSSSTGAATIGAATGIAAGVSGGSSSITAVFTTAYGSKSASASLTVTTATLEAVTVTPYEQTIVRSTKIQLKATGVFSDNTTRDITEQAVWASTDTNKATVSDTAGTKGLVTADNINTGSCNITAILSGKTGTTPLTVKNASLLSITVTPINPLAYGTTQQFSAIGQYDDSTTQNLTASAVWTSSLPGVATISNAFGSQGLATSVAAGITQIKATFSSIEGTTSLEVKIISLQSISITPLAPTKNIGQTVNFYANGTYSDSTVQDLTTQVVWSSSNTAIAEINNADGFKGITTTLSGGTATISATRDGITRTTTINVNNSDTDPPTITAAAILSGNRVRVLFSEDMNIIAATTIANFKIADSSTLSGSCSDNSNFTGSTQTLDFTISSITPVTLSEFIFQLSAPTDAKTYTVIGNKTALKDVSDNLLTCNNYGSFVGTDNVSPYMVSAINPIATGIIVKFSEEMQSDGIAGAANYKDEYTLSEFVDDGNPLNNPVILSITKIDGKTYQLNLDKTVLTVKYKILNSNAKDIAGNIIGNPNFLTFDGNEQLRVVAAEALTLTTIKVTFNKNVATTSANCSDLGTCAELYKILPDLGGITSAVRGTGDSANTAVITHQNNQDGIAYALITANRLDGDQFNNLTDNKSIRNEADTQDMQAQPKDRSIFIGLGTVIITPEDGAQYDDPFGDLSAFGFSFIYNDRVYIGPNASNNSLVRFDPDGRNLIQIGFDIKYWLTDHWEYYPAAQRYDFGHQTTDFDGGPDLIDGIGYFTSVTINGVQYLVAGAQELSGANPKLNQLYLSKEYDTTLPFFKCGLSSPANVSSTSAIYGAEDKLFVGMASSAAAQKPGFNVISVSNETCGAPLSFGKDIPGIKGLATVRTIIGIDTINKVTISATNYLIVANSNAFAISVLDGTNPDSAADFADIQYAAWNRSGTTNTRVYNKVTPLEPWERGISGVVQFDGKVFVARNRCTLASAANDALCSTSLTPELWMGTVSGDPKTAGNWTWTKVWDAVDFTLANGFSSNWGTTIDAISLVIVNGNRLYIGLDSTTDGAHLVYTTSVPGAGVSNFTEIGRGTAACGYLDSKAFGKSCSSKRFYSGASIIFAGSSYFYMSVGDGTIALKVYKQVD